MAVRKPELDGAVARYYAQAPEEDRLKYGAAMLEEARTRELIQRHAPSPPAVVLDVGGGAGAYAFWLADLGYRVHLIDAAPRLIDKAKQRGAAERLASSSVGDARAIEFPNAQADVVLLLGPLYHLTEAADRARALAEAKRVLTPGGWLFGAVISRWASLLDGLSRDLFADPRFGAIVTRDLEDGQHRNPTDRLDYFTTAYFHRPSEAVDEVRSAGFTDTRIYGIEGPGWLVSSAEKRVEDLLMAARITESESALLGISAHLLVVARKPE